MAALIKTMIEKWVALYVRLSRDDENEGDSNSIAHQIEILTRYAKEHGITHYKIYKDDGYSGTNFNRPGFLEMLADIEAGMVSMVVVKDMSRFGRNYLEVGLYTEIRFPELGVRFVAVNDGVDTIWPQLFGSGPLHGNPFPGVGRPVCGRQRWRGQRQSDGQ